MFFRTRRSRLSALCRQLLPSVTDLRRSTIRGGADEGLTNPGWGAKIGTYSLAALMDTNPTISADRPTYPHSVKFYNDDRSLGRTVAEFLAPGLKERHPAIVIATPDHRALIARELVAHDVNVHHLENTGDLQLLDAEEILSHFMVGQEPDPARFHATIDELIARACKDRLPCPLRAYGEMVDILWKRANSEGAIRLEMLWNRVATQAEFSLLCGYAVGSFYKEIAKGPGFQTVCDQHNHVMPDDESA
jgi:hypothetical protein